MNELPIICQLSEAQLEQRREQFLQRIGGGAQAVEPLDSGYAFRFPSDHALQNDLLRAIQRERECCPFLQFRLTFEPQNGPVRLEVTGPTGTKAFLALLLDLPA